MRAIVCYRLRSARVTAPAVNVLNYCTNRRLCRFRFHADMYRYYCSSVQYCIILEYFVLYGVYEIQLQIYRPTHRAVNNS